ncbi:DUF4010 domain-containing protein [Ferrovum sp.]|uniref:MgtC/SapB family protein n=1 Tax=Ferrovum sp. TaxID=2609467 RepID=UPI00260A0869|nr:DUF4010 domain-containing protein [Ferrovum sp.]
MSQLHLFLLELSSQLGTRFLLVVCLGFLTGLEFREYLLTRHLEHPLAMGSSRTYAFIAALGFLLYYLNPTGLLYLGGMVFLITLFVQFYHHKLQVGQKGIHQFLIGMLVYTYGPSSQFFPLWFLILIFVSVVLILGARPLTHHLIATMDRLELLTLSKFLLLSAVILPLLPKEYPFKNVPLTPFSVWMAVVVISAISYAGYLLRRYVFKRSGYLLTGLLGGIYSSTATIVVLARASAPPSASLAQIHGGILSAVGMMYGRLLLLVLLMAPMLLPYCALPLLGGGMIALGLAWLSQRKTDRKTPDALDNISSDNPLALRTALLFALLFVLMTVLTHFVLQDFGSGGIEVLALVIGFTDINPFVMSLLNNSHHDLALTQSAGALVMAAGSNILLESGYTLILGNHARNRGIFLKLFGLGGATLLFGLGIF